MAWGDYNRAVRILKEERDNAIANAGACAKETRRMIAIAKEQLHARKAAEARLALVIAEIDDPTWGGADSLDMFARNIRATAAGDTP